MIVAGPNFPKKGSCGGVLVVLFAVLGDARAGGVLVVLFAVLGGTRAGGVLAVLFAVIGGTRASGVLAVLFAVLGGTREGGFFAVLGGVRADFFLSSSSISSKTEFSQSQPSSVLSTAHLNLFNNVGV